MLITTACLAADPVTLNPNHPDRYVVVKGDTLWDISGRFLRDPWRWPEVWHVNQQIANPHLIYPGDILVLTYVNGQPRLTLQRGSTVKLSPTIRSTLLDNAIPAIPYDAILPFLSRAYIVDKDDLEARPYVLDYDDEHIIGGAGTRVYVRKINDADYQQYEIVRLGGVYKDGDTGKVLGHEAIYLGDAQLEQTGDPATLLLTRTKEEILPGDRLMPITKDRYQGSFFPKAPKTSVLGNIIAVMDGVSQIGQYHVVVIDRGAHNGLEVGDVLAIDQRGEFVPDPITEDRFDRVKLPDERAGLLMIFRTFDRVSFGLVMSATRSMHVMDRVHNP